MIESIFERTIIEKGLIKNRDKLLLGVSGGPDSICLLHLFARFQPQYRLKLQAVHFNHGLREEADSEAGFVFAACRELGIDCIVEKREVKKFYEGDSLEQTARSLRFDFFMKCSRQARIKKIALAHHKDDLAETVLMRLVRGTGLRGLRGFLPKTKYKNLNVIRPLIGIEKADILSWLTSQNISYCLDKSNLDRTFLRNRIRLEILPLLKQLNPNITDSLFNLAYSAAGDYELVHRTTFEFFKSAKKREGKNCLELELKKVKALSEGLCNNVLRMAIEQLKGDTRRIESRHLWEIRDLIGNRPVRSRVDLPYLSAETTTRMLILRLKRTI